MVGINIVMSQMKNKSLLNSLELEDIQKKMLHYNSFKSRVLFQNPNLFKHFLLYK